MENLKLLYALLVHYQYNMRCLHWKVCGLDFDTKHELAGSYIEVLEKYLDEVAEILLSLGETPYNLSNVLTTLENNEKTIVTVSCEGDSYYTAGVMMDIINNMFNSLIDMYELICNNDQLPGDVVSKLQEQEYFFRIETRYKGKNRLVTFAPAAQ